MLTLSVIPAKAGIQRLADAERNPPPSLYIKAMGWAQGNGEWRRRGNHPLQSNAGAFLEQGLVRQRAWRPVLERLRDVLRGDGVFAGEVGNRPRQF